MSLDDGVSWAIGLSAMVAAPLGRYDEGVAIARRGIDLHPGNADVRAFLGYVMMYAGHYREAEENFRAAMLLNPFYPNWYRNGLLLTLLYLDEFDEALSLTDEVLESEPAHFHTWLSRAYIHGQQHREADASEAVYEVRRLAPNLCVRNLPGLLLIRDKAALKRFSDGVREAGLPE